MDKTTKKEFEFEEFEANLVPEESRCFITLMEKSLGMYHCIVHHKLDFTRQPYSQKITTRQAIDAKLSLHHKYSLALT